MSCPWQTERRFSVLDKNLKAEINNELCLRRRKTGDVTLIRYKHQQYLVMIWTRCHAYCQVVADSVAVQAGVVDVKVTQVEQYNSGKMNA